MCRARFIQLNGSLRGGDLAGGALERTAQLQLHARLHGMLGALQSLPRQTTVLLALLLLLQTAQCNFHFRYALQYRLAVRQHTGLQLVILGILCRATDAPVKQRNVQHRSSRCDAVGCG